MREIKFRAWNKVQKKMHEVDGLDFVFTPPALLELNHDKPEIKVVDYWVSDGDFELMQFTGLKDKNGKEIYEGDIVEWELNPMFSKPEKSRAEVRWSEQLLLPHINNTSKVIGNIYKNPELLK